ncbi:MAG: hypothetical protein UV73_C0012G0117 [Candidatus Gottesmanbacteria bacterium GW2011_GWA2_43_14]|uniref:Glycosyltransferase RgtA/B/C/D-like domain-containing protein n=1 Tax=Candidatus Gottesmanbacteria bacterium GW2011_GWA2_43_14 TaxID=1618443 RepID=A0A0G1DER0_9BACT|nr:MAG: hypothetical protein UV73_C0012G0117 [Candidatus Gottesmanbacteria bacterium GW2011_GWA2_43_14]
MIKRNLSAFVFFGLLSLVITLPLLKPGYILTLDMVQVPDPGWPSPWQVSFPVALLNKLFVLFLPSYWFPKIVLFLVFFLSGVSMATFVGTGNILVNLFAGTIYTLNPFVYERVMAGHWYFLLGYALFPWLVKSVVDLFRRPALTSTLKLALLATLIFNLFLHFTVIFAVFFVIYAIFFLIVNSRNIKSKLYYYLSLFLFVIFIFNLNWLLPTLAGKSTISDSLSSFSRQDLYAFQTVADPQFGLIFNLLSGFGFWEEVYDYFISQKQIIPFWPLLSLPIIALSIMGLVYLLTKKENWENLVLNISLLVVFILALDFAGGIALKQFAPTVFALYDRIPILYGLREPQKLVMLMMFSYAYFGAYGLKWFKSLVKPLAAKLLVIGGFFLIPFVYTPLIFAGFWGQLKPVFYPESWYRVSAIINADNDNFRMLFLPWHQYLRFNFNHNLVIANPVPEFFNKPVLASRNYETRPLYSHDQRPEALHMEGLFSIQEKKVNLFGQEVEYPVDWSRDLAIIDIKYIMLSKDSDWLKYKFLDDDPELYKQFEDDSLILYRNLMFGVEPVYPEPEPSPTVATGSAGLENEETSTAPAETIEEE